MKKSNVTIIATVIIALHLFIFILLVGSSRDKTDTADATLPAPAAPAAVEAAAPASSMPDFEIPNLAMPVEVVVREAARQRVPVPKTAPESIATPGLRDGYLKNNQPSRRTSKIFGKLVGNPYQGAIVVDARTGKILYENRATSYSYPASITKLMTMLVVLEEIDAGRISLHDKVKITKEVAGIGGSEVYLDVRESGFYTVEDLLKALMIHSANDAARALALHVAGTRDAFVRMMNEKARKLGMNATVYHTEHGLPPSDGTQPDISTAYDVAILSLAALRHPETLRYTGAKLEWLPKSAIRKEKFMLANRNALVGKERYEGCDGLKTGYHSRGGYSLTATAVQDGRRVVAVVLGVADRSSRNATMRKLLDKGFDIFAK